MDFDYFNRFFGPICDLHTKGRRLTGSNYNDLQHQLLIDEHIVGLFDLSIFRVAPLLDCESKFNGYMEQYKRGQLISCEFYAVRAEFLPSRRWTTV